MTKLWSVEELATFLGVPRSWIYDRTRRHGPEVIPHFKMGKYLRFDPYSPAFAEWLATHAISKDTRARYNRAARTQTGRVERSSDS